LLIYNPTPIQEIHSKSLAAAGVRLLVKREDLNHPYISGNKLWKLKYNLEEVRRKLLKVVITFGGAYSNHIYATAAAAKESGLKSIGIIRGEETLPLNSTLTFAKQCGMDLHYVSREEYRNKNEKTFIENLHNRFGDFYLIPEGGSNSLAVKGCAEFAQTLNDVDFNYCCLPVGTGGTIAGIIAGLKKEKEIIGFPVLKGGEFLQTEIENFLKEFSNDSYQNWKLDTTYHHGGYAKATPELLAFIKMMRDEHNLPLESIYTGKLLWAVMDYVVKGEFKKGSTILVLHTGGLQGQKH
jgi:1-aminocyclopropane-1-carboxylate deaminase/D-cysteine desulfhydrase-like pyridoxal-dependent ACC family enzyme